MNYEKTFKIINKLCKTASTDSCIDCFHLKHSRGMIWCEAGVFDEYVDLTQELTLRDQKILEILSKKNNCKRRITCREEN